MAHNYIDTPRTDAADRTRFDTTVGDISFSAAEPSFMPPQDGRDNLITNMRKMGAGSLATPRAPLAFKRNAQAKAEFTPLLQSATKNAARLRGAEDKENKGGIPTPAALKPGFTLPGSPYIPEASDFGSSSVVDGDKTPVAVQSSSVDISTPHVILGNGDLGVDKNVLTLKEQENKLEQIDKENFGLKLKIHFLEEALKKNGPDHFQQTTKDNVELRTNAIQLERDLKKYRKMLTSAEQSIEQYKIQFKELTEKVKSRHKNEIMNEELESLQQLADERLRQIQKLQRQLEETEDRHSNSQEVDKLQEEVEELEAELKDKECALDEKDEQLEALQEKLKPADGDIDIEVEERDRKIDQQAEELEALREQVQRLERERDEDDDVLQEKLDAANEEHVVEVEDLRKQLELAERDKREQLRHFESRLQAYDREKRAELETAERKLDSLEKEKASEIESLEMRLKLAESKGDNQSQLAQQAAADAHERLKKFIQEKDDEIEDLRSQIHVFEGIQDQLETCQKQLGDYAQDVQRRHEEESRKEETISQLRQSLQEKERELRTVRATLQGQDAIAEKVDKLRSTVHERDREVSILKEATEAQAVALDELKQLRSKLNQQESQNTATTHELKAAQSMISDLKRDVERLQQTLKDRESELEVLRQGNEEPDSQLEGLQSIVRHRDSDLEDLRLTLSKRDKEIEELMESANERLEIVEKLREEMVEQKRDLEDEIAVLEQQIDEAEADKEELRDEVARLEKESEETYKTQTSMSPIKKELRDARREKEQLQTKVQRLAKEEEQTRVERASLQGTISRLQTELADARSELRSKTSAAAQLKTGRLEQEISDLHKALERKTAALTEAESNLASLADKDECVRLPGDADKNLAETTELRNLLKDSALQIESLRLDLAQKQKTAASEISNLKKTLRAKERQLQDLEESSRRHISAQAKMQDTREEVARLQIQFMESEKKHGREIRGLTKTLIFLRAKLDRETALREGLGWQKRWFLLMVDMYGRCNRADLKLIEEMGITPDRSFRERAKRPGLRAVAWAAVFCERARKAAAMWREKRGVQEALVRKLEGMRGRRMEEKRVVEVLR